MKNNDAILKIIVKFKKCVAGIGSNLKQFGLNFNGFGPINYLLVIEIVEEAV